MAYLLRESGAGALDLGECAFAWANFFVEREENRHMRDLQDAA